MQQLSVKELKQIISSGQETPLLLDVREPWEFDICHIDGAKLIPMREFHHAMDDLNRDQHTVVICHHGIRSQQVCYYLDRMGFNNVFNLSGGVHAWAMEIDHNMPTY